MMRFRRLPVVLAVSIALLAPAMATAHPDHPDPAFSSVEMFPGEGVGVTADLQHSTSGGHLDPVQEKVTLVGKAEVNNPSGDGNDGRVADVFAHGDHAYLTAFREPTCEQAGVHVMDISDPAAPFEVTDAFIPTTVGSYAGEGIQVIPMDNQFFTGDLLIHQNETCPAGPPPPSVAEKGGINLWDVTDPTEAEPVKLHAGDLAGGLDAGPNQTHSMRAWTNAFDGRTYVVLVDDEELTDIDILDITDPFHPVLINDDLNLDETPFDVDQASPSNLTASFSHDMMIEKIGQRYVMNMNYWDGGYVLLDVTNPREGHVTLIAESDYPALDEERLARGHSISPEGNAHQSELSPNNKFLLATDEDFNPHRVVATITSGPYSGTEYTATSASATPPIEPGTSIIGTPTYVGLGCDPLPPGTGIALVERGVCTFQVKLDRIEAAGYTAGIVFNAVRADCMAGASMLAEGDIPYVFVNRLTGLQLLGVAGVNATNACTTASPSAGSTVSSTTIEAVFDGWGFVRLFATEIPNQRGQPGSITSIDTYAVPESQDEAFATDHGHLSVHEVAMAPETGLAYISYYAAGFRVVTYGPNGIQEVGAFIDEGGNNFWGVEVWHDEHGTEYVLASDRDYGLYIFQYTP
jgi:hypothetical protein